MKKFKVSINASSNIDDIGIKLDKELKAKVLETMQTPKFGFPADEAEEYSAVDVIQLEDGLKAEVRAEVSYEGLELLCEALDPIVAKYDTDAYFEPEVPGIISAYLYNI